MIALTTAQVDAWRLAAHHLDTPAPAADWPVVVADLGGLHAQLMSSAVLSLAARVDGLPPDTVERALWAERRLVKLWCMRGTLHLVPAADLPRLVAALRPRQRYYYRPAWLRYYGLSHAEMATLLAGVRAALDGRVLTREELATAVAQETGLPHLRTALLSSWGGLLKAAAYEGSLIFGPNRGTLVTFMRPDGWLGPWVDHDPATAMAEILRRFLAAYGPATPAEFARWWGGGGELAAAKRLFAALGPELVEVEVDGRTVWALAAALPALRAAGPPAGVRLLPFFDPYTIGLAPVFRAALPPAQVAAIYRPQGWIAPVVLVAGRPAATWRAERKGGRVLLSVTWFAPPDAATRATLLAEADRLAPALGGPVELRDAPPGAEIPLPAPGADDDTPGVEDNPAG